MYIGNKSYRYSVELIIFFFVTLQLMVDSLYGFFIFKLNVDTGISSLYKIFMIFLCVYYITRYTSKKNISYLALIIICFSLVIFIELFRSQGISIGLSISELMKLTMTYIVFITVSNFKEINPNKLLTLFVNINIGVLCLNILMSLLGFGESTYSDFGAKGFFYAGNALSSVIVVISGIRLFLSINKSVVNYLCYLSLFLIISSLIGTKTSIIFVVITGILFPFLFKKRKLMYIILMLAIPMVVLFIFYNIDSFKSSELITRIQYFYDTGGISRVIFSERDSFIRNNIPLFLNGNLNDILFGVGYSKLVTLAKPLTEVDPIDILLSYGIFIFLIYYICFFVIIKKTYGLLAFKMIILNDYVKLSLYLLLLFIFISSIAGHVLFNGMVTIFLGVIMGIPFWVKNFYMAHINENA